MKRIKYYKTIKSYDKYGDTEYNCIAMVYKEEAHYGMLRWGHVQSEKFLDMGIESIFHLLNSNYPQFKYLIK